MPKYNLLSISLVLCSLLANAQSAQLTADCYAINRLNTAVTYGTMPKRKAAEQFKILINEVKAHCAITSKLPWAFPLSGYNYKAIGGNKGSGYSSAGYNYLDGNKHAAHPAHDIFIRDNNQDDLDDRTYQPVDVLAVTDGVVIACNSQWQPGSTQRGGKYIWLYHPQLNSITYYAHNRAVFVKPGDVVKQGAKIAEVGRTGFNAYKKRSPTHLHFSAFSLAHGLPLPYNPYTTLTQAKTL
jgi:murein DD-endopeptidase MepM/ murein hydrolase activator NlpD